MPKTIRTPTRTPAPRGFFARLARDRAANTLVIMAMALIPISGLAGSAVDMARLYVVKSRLQQACDAGVLAGRKFMSATSGSSTLDTTAVTRANTFFKNNFSAGWLDTATPTFTPVKTADQQVSGTASVKVPMTIMKMFAAPDVTINVACKARYDVSDTDIVFVLDTTGSMACRPQDTDAQCSTYVNNNPAVAFTRPSSDPDATAGYLGSTSFAVPETTSTDGSRIKALRQAVKDFYATVAANIDSSTRVRYGFVTYTSIINAGKAIYSVSPSYLIGGTSGETVDYETRQVSGEYQVSLTGVAQNNSKSQTGCTSSAKTPTRSPANSTANPYTFRTSDGQASYTWQDWDSSAGKCTDYTKVVGPIWTYRQANLDVSKFITGATVTDPTHVTGDTSRWDGCIEERQTQAATTTFNSSSYDLNPTLVPTSDVATRWRPAWADATWARWNYGSTAVQTTNGDTMPSSNPPVNVSIDARVKSGYYSCGKPIHRLSVMSASDVASYVDATDFKPLGGTYHDTGMIWGVRLLAPNGIFAADNTGRTGQPSPKKVIVFMTDGTMAPNQNIYGQYGIEYFDRRVSGGAFTSLTDYHNARLLYECDQARQIGIDVWTVAIDDAANAQLTQCAANTGQAFFTTSASGLTGVFQTIAKQVAMLRLDQ